MGNKNTMENIDENWAILKSLQADTFEEKAFGCILGAFVGDSCGSLHEFIDEILSDEEMEKCMRMEGGGPW